MKLQPKETNPPANEQGLAEPEKSQRIVRYLPLIIALVFGTLWALLYLFLGRIHGMWPMYDKEFPFLLSSLIGIHKQAMSPIVGMLFAFMDGALVAFTMSWLFTLLLRNRWRAGLTPFFIPLDYVIAIPECYSVNHECPNHE